MLEKEGLEVFRTAGSHGRADLIAVFPSDYDLQVHECRLIQIKTCHEKDLAKYKKEKVKGVELWIKILGHGWLQIN